MTDTNYDTDFYAWTQAQAALLRAKDWTQVDWGHLIEEIESLGDQYRHALQSHLRVLLWHLLKHRYQPARRTPSWRRSVINARQEIEAILERNPSLRGALPKALAWAYSRARRAANQETGQPLATYPETCPWPLDRVLDEDFWPPEA